MRYRFSLFAEERGNGSTIISLEGGKHFTQHSAVNYCNMDYVDRSAVTDNKTWYQLT